MSQMKEVSSQGANTINIFTNIQSVIEGLKDSLNSSEKEKLLNLCKRHMELENKEMNRQRVLKIETDFFKNLLPINESSFLHCTLCNSLYIPILNSMYTCLICRKEVCSNCIKSFKSPSIIDLCKVCHADRLQKMKSGQWFIDKLNLSKKDAMLESQSNSSSIKNRIPSQEKLEEGPPIIAVQRTLENLLSKEKKSGDNSPNGRPSSEIQRRLENLLSDERNNSDSPSQVGSGRTSPSRDSYNSVSMDYVSRSKLATNLKKKYQVKVAGNRDLAYSEDNLSDLMSVNSTISAARTVFSVSNVSKNGGHTNGFIKSRDCHDDHSTRNKARSLSNSFSQASLSSFNSEAFCCDFVTHGEVLIKIEFVHKHLQILVINCTNLPIANKKDGVTNPYVKLYLLPDKSTTGKRKTQKITNNTNPEFNKLLHYHTDKASLTHRTLNISVWHYQSAHNRTFLGEVNVPMSDVNLNSQQEMPLRLHTREQVPQILSLISYNGEVLVGIRFATTKDFKIDSTFNRISFIISIKNGRNIGNPKDSPSPYVKCTVTCNESRLSVQETKVVYQTTNPIWDEELSYDNIDRSKLHDLEIELLVLSKRKMTKDHPLGKILLMKKCNENDSSKCQEKDSLLWKRFLESYQGQAVEDYLPLRTMVD